MAAQLLVIYISVHSIFGLAFLLALIMSADVKEEDMDDEL